VRRAMRMLAMSLLVPVVLIGLSTEVEAGKKSKPPKVATGPMDDGLLDPFWFGEGLEFREADEIDYLWVKPGFELSGSSLHFTEWPEPEFRGKAADKRDAEDHRLARAIAAEMPRTLAEAYHRVFGGRLETSLSEGNVLVEGRVVDCSAGSAAAKALVGFGAGSGNTTIDLKLTDAGSGELLMALHHRVVSGSTLSTTDSKFFKWVEKTAERMADDGVQALYADGDPTNK
jgi:hypothetical protein